MELGISAIVFTCLTKFAGKMGENLAELVKRVPAWGKLMNWLRRKSPPPQNIPKSSVIKFVGRDEDIKKLHQQLQQGQKIIIAIAGMGGIGKTELALQYAQKHWQQQTYKGGVCWLQAGNENPDLRLQLVNFAKSHFDLRPQEDWDLQKQLHYCWRNWQKGIVAAMIETHPKYALSFSWVQKVRNEAISGYISTHSLAELYSVLTRLPLPKPISPQQAYNGIMNNLKGFQTIDLDSHDYLNVIENISQLQITGGGIFDAIIAQAALKANVDILLTLNPKHFRRLGESIASLVQDPSIN